MYWRLAPQADVRRAKNPASTSVPRLSPENHNDPQYHPVSPSATWGVGVYSGSRLTEDADSASATLPARPLPSLREAAPPQPAESHSMAANLF